MSTKNNNDSKPIKTIAVDTGKKIHVGKVILRSKKSVKEQIQPQSHSIEEEPYVPPVKKERPVESQKKVPLYAETVEFDDSGDFASMLEESSYEPNIAINVGDKVSGKVIHIGKENIFVALGPKVEAAMALDEWLDEHNRLTVRLGQHITSYVLSTNGGVTLSNNIAQSNLDMSMLEEALSKQIPIEGKVIAANKGGFDIMVANKKAFCPISQIDSSFVEDPDSYLNKTFNFLIERIEDDGRNIVVSRRKLLNKINSEKAQQTIQDLKVGDVFRAIITKVADFGAFAEVGGIQGLIPRSEISHGRIDRVSDILSTNDPVEVILLSMDIDEANPLKSKLTFSLKKAKEDPYKLHWHKVKPGESMEGKVVRLESFGAFVELFPGIDGLIHISELSENKVSHPQEVLKLKQPISVKVISVDEEEKRISLTIREGLTRHQSKATITTVQPVRGQKLSGVVSRIERYGVFLELESGLSALLPAASETGLPKHSDLNRCYKLGDSIDVVVIDVDQKNRIRVSNIARKDMDERDSYLKFKGEESKGSFGTLAQLLNKKR